MYAHIHIVATFVGVPLQNEVGLRPFPNQHRDQRRRHERNDSKLPR